MMKLAIGIIVVFLSSLLWACLKAGSDADDYMGYDDIIEGEVESDGIR